MIEEVSLTNVMDKQNIMKRRKANLLAWNVEGEKETVESHSWRNVVMENGSTSVTLGPLEIKTFVVTLA